MPLSQLDPKTALIVIDLQQGIVELPGAHPMTEIVANSALLAHAFRDAGQTVCLVNVTGRAPGRTDSGPGGGALPAAACALVPELSVSAGDLLITKERVGAFIGTSLHADLQARGVTQVVFTGVSTSAGVEASVRSAYDHGYNVVVVTDAMTDRSPSSHEHAVNVFFPRVAETTTTAAVLAALQA